MTDFYDQLVPFYHLIHQDWDASIRRQGDQLSALIRSEWPERSKAMGFSINRFWWAPGPHSMGGRGHEVSSYPDLGRA